jgi:U3 small nucleolar RNA-associated protein 21
LQVETTEALQSRISKLEVSRDASSRSARLSHLLKVASQEGAAQPVIDYLKSSSPSRVDLDIRSLDVRCIEGRCEMVDFIVVLTKTLQSRRDFELVNTLMAVFIRAHVDIVREAASCGNSAPPLSALKTILLKWQTEQQREAERLSRLVGYCRGVAGFLRSAR